MSDELDLDPTMDTEEFDTELDEQDLGEADAAEDNLDDEEAHKGYLRQADYTRKTQLLAEERKALKAERAKYEDALKFVEWVRTNPKATAALSAIANGRDLDYEDYDPVDSKVREAESKAEKALRAIEGERMERKMERAIAEYGLAADTDDLFDFMKANGISEPRTAARLMAVEMAEQAKSAARAKATAAKGVLPHSGTARRGATAKRADYSKVSYDDLIEDVLAEV